MAKGRKMGKQAYRMTARRKSALRKAQLISARKRRKNNAVKAGVLAGGLALAAYGGHRYGSNVSDMAKNLKNRHFRSTNPANTKAHVVSQGVKEAVIQAQAVSPPTAAQRRGARVNGPDMHNTSVPAAHNGPAKDGHYNGWAALGVPGPTPPKSVQHLPQAESIIDPTPPVRSPFPAEHMPHPDQIIKRLAKEGRVRNVSDLTQEDIQIISKLWTAEKLQGVRLPKGHGKRSNSVGNIGLYVALLDRHGLEKKGSSKKA